jgi:hypothetical protein
MDLHRRDKHLPIKGDSHGLGQNMDGTFGPIVL